MTPRKRIKLIIAAIKKLDDSANGQMVYTSKIKDNRVQFYQSITGFIKGKYYRVRFWIMYNDPTVVEMEIPENVECKDIICNIWDNID